YRKSLSLKVVAITGSNGKTSTKDFAAAVLARRFKVTKTEGNFNNHVGLPRTILEATTQDEVAVWEIGMNHPGEVAALATIASPDDSFRFPKQPLHLGLWLQGWCAEVQRD